MGEVDARTSETGAELCLAPHRLRITAFGVDTLVLGVVFAVAFALDKLARIPTVLVVIACVLGAVYYLGVSVWIMDGRTAGKAACGLAVRRVDGRPIDGGVRGLVWSLARHSVGYVIADVFGLGLLLAFVTRRHRCLHDYAFGTEVVLRPSTDDDTWFGRYEAFWKDFQTNHEQLLDRYHWFLYPWKWVTRVVVAVASFLVVTGRTLFGASEAVPATTVAPRRTCRGRASQRCGRRRRSPLARSLSPE